MGTSTSYIASKQASYLATSIKKENTEREMVTSMDEIVKTTGYNLL